MLSVFVNKNSDVNRANLEVKLKKLKGREVMRFDDSNFSVESLNQYISSEDLFGEEFVVVFDRVLTLSEAEEFFFKNLKELVISNNQFIFLLESFKSEEIKKVERAGGEVLKDEAKEIKKKEDFNIFSLTEALGNRDKKNLWVLYIKALREGKTPEEINGVLFWQLKSIGIATQNGNLNPFVKTKSLRFSKNFKEGEIKTLARKLVDEYHLSRMKGPPLTERLERFILSI